MAQINITLNQEEILEVLSRNRDEAFKIIVQKILNQIMLAESKEQLQAEPYERCEARTDCRNGIRGKTFQNQPLTIPFCFSAFSPVQRRRKVLY